ncbi:MAG: hypothetical protein ACP5G4_00975 [bacterium]
MTLTSFLIEKKIWGLNPAGYHFVNILLNAVCTILLYLIAKIFLKKPIYAFLTTLLFLFHPAHPAAVHWISARGDLFCTAGYLAGIYFSLRYSIEGGKAKIFLAGAFFLAASFSKEMAVTAPAVAVLTAYAATKAKWKGRIRFVFATAFVPILVFAILRVAFLGTSAAGGETYYLAFGKFLAVNAAKAGSFLIVPFGHEAAERLMFAEPQIFLGLAGLCAVVLGVGLFFAVRRNYRVLLLVIALAVSVLPVMGMAMRWHMYLPSALLALVIGELLFGNRARAMNIGIFFIVFLLFGIGYIQLRSRMGRSSELARRLIKQGEVVLEKSPRAESFVFLMLPSKVYRSGTYTNGFVPTLQAVSGDCRPMLEVLPSVHYGDYRSCEFEVNSSRLTVGFDSPEDYIAPRVRSYIIGERQLGAGELIATQDGVELRVKGVSELGRVSSAEVNLEQNVFPQNSDLFIYYRGDWLQLDI